MADLALAALWYAEKLHWAVLPLHSPTKVGCSCGVKDCHSVGKHPRTPHGSNDATTDRATLLDWWRQWPNANIGIATGKRSGIIVIDVDPRNGGNETIKQIVKEHGKFLRTLIAVTGGGGRHLFYAYTDSELDFKIGAGVDVKSDGSYVVAAPSLHESGAQYRWLRRFSSGLKLRRLPIWAKLAGEPRKDSAKPNDVLREGERNSGLTSMAGRWRRTGMDEFVLFDALWSYNRQYCEPPLDEREVRSIARSVSRYTASSDLEREIERYSDPEGPLPFNDLGNAQRLARNHGEDLRYAPGIGWLIWNGKYWERDDLKQMRLRAYEVGQSVRQEVLEQSLPDKELAAAMRHAMYSESERGLSAMIKVAEPLPGIAEPLASFDRDPMLFNVLNGTIDLGTGALRPHSRSDYLTKLAQVFYEPKAKAPRFIRFLAETFAGDETIIDYLQRVFGYAMTGLVTEQLFIVCWGKGGNGKTRLIEDALGAVFGPDYMGHLSASALLDKRYAGHPTDIADLRGKRLVIATESGARRSLDEEIIKQLTGGDTVRARYMHKDFFEFQPTHQLILVTNHKPRASISESIWRRLQLVPFEHKPKAEDIDRDLGAKLRAEASGILSWLVAGCLAWQHEGGLTPPSKVLIATEEHKEAEDIFGMFLRECCTFEHKARVWGSVLYERYTVWCLENSIRGKGRISFNRELMERDLGIEKRVSNGQVRWRGLKINDFRGIKA